jgi:hypothetical protein
LTNFWTSLVSGDVTIGESMDKSLSPVDRAQYFRPLTTIFAPNKGNLLRLLGAQSAASASPDQGFDLEEAEKKLAKGMLPADVLPWLTKRLLTLHARTGSAGFASGVSPMPPLSAGAGQSIPEPKDSHLARAQAEQARRRELLNVIDNTLSSM